MSNDLSGQSTSSLIVQGSYGFLTAIIGQASGQAVLSGQLTQNNLVGPSTSNQNLITSAQTVNTLTIQVSLFTLWNIAYQNYYVTYTYTSGIMTGSDMYADNTLSVHLFSKIYSYVSGVISSVLITRISDGHTATKNLSWSAGALLTKIVSQA